MNCAEPRAPAIPFPTLSPSSVSAGAPDPVTQPPAAQLLFLSFLAKRPVGFPGLTQCCIPPPSPLLPLLPLPLPVLKVQQYRDVESEGPGAFYAVDRTTPTRLPPEAACVPSPGGGGGGRKGSARWHMQAGGHQRRKGGRLSQAGACPGGSGSEACPTVQVQSAPSTGFCKRGGDPGRGRQEQRRDQMGTDAPSPRSRGGSSEGGVKGKQVVFSRPGCRGPGHSPHFPMPTLKP